MINLKLKNNLLIFIIIIFAFSGLQSYEKDALKRILFDKLKLFIGIEDLAQFLSDTNYVEVKGINKGDSLIFRLKKEEQTYIVEKYNSIYMHKLISPDSILTISYDKGDSSSNRSVIYIAEKTKSYNRIIDKDYNSSLIYYEYECYNYDNYSIDYWIDEYARAYSLENQDYTFNNARATIINMRKSFFDFFSTEHISKILLFENNNLKYQLYKSIPGYSRWSVPCYKYEYKNNKLYKMIAFELQNKENILEEVFERLKDNEEIPDTLIFNKKTEILNTWEYEYKNDTLTNLKTGFRTIYTRKFP